MRAPLVLHMRLAARLRELAAEARALGARLGAAELEAYANAVEKDYDAIRRVARELKSKAEKFVGREKQYPIGRVWRTGADIAARPQRLRQAPRSPVGLAALAPERRAAIQAAGRRANAARLADRRAARAPSKGWARGERHPCCKLTDAQVAEIRHLMASAAMTNAALARRYGVSPELIRKIRLGKIRKLPTHPEEHR